MRWVLLLGLGPFDSHDIYLGITSRKTTHDIGKSPCCIGHTVIFIHGGNFQQFFFVLSVIWAAYLRWGCLTGGWPSEAPTEAGGTVVSSLHQTFQVLYPKWRDSEPCKAIFGRVFPYKSRIHTAYIGEDSSI